MAKETILQQTDWTPGEATPDDTRFGAEVDGQTTPRNLSLAQIATELVNNNLIVPEGATFAKLADLTAATIGSSVDVVSVLGYTADYDHAETPQLYRRAASEPSHPGKTTSNGGTVHWEMTGVINTQAFGMFSSNTAAENDVAFSNAMEAVAELSTGTHVDVVIPASPTAYILNPVNGSAHTANGVHLDVNEGSNVHLKAYGATLKYEDNCFADAGAINNFFHLLLVTIQEASTTAGRVIVEGLTTNGNFANQPAPSPSTQYEQATALKANVGTSYISTSTIDEVQFINCRSIDPVAGFIQVGPSDSSIGINRGLVDGVHEGDRDSGRGTVTSGCSVRDMVVRRVYSDDGGSNESSLETEWTNIVPGETYTIKISECVVGRLDFATKGEDDADSCYVQVVNSTVKHAMAASWVDFHAVNSDIKWSGDGDVSNPSSKIDLNGVTLRLGTDGAGTVYKFGFTGTSTTSRLFRMKGGRVVIDDPAASFTTGVLFDSGNEPQSEVDNYVLEFEDVKFDERATECINGYAGQTIRTKNCEFGGDVGVVVGSFSSLYGCTWEDDNSDFRRCTNPFKVQTTGPASLCVVELRGAGKHSVDSTGFAETDSDNDYPASFRLCEWKMPVTSKPTGGGVLGAIAYVPNTTDRWRCTATDATAATWVEIDDEVRRWQVEGDAITANVSSTDAEARPGQYDVGTFDTPPSGSLTYAPDLTTAKQGDVWWFRFPGGITSSNTWEFEVGSSGIWHNLGDEFTDPGTPLVFGNETIAGESARITVKKIGTPPGDPHEFEVELFHNPFDVSTITTFGGTAHKFLVQNVSTGAIKAVEIDDVLSDALYEASGDPTAALGFATRQFVLANLVNNIKPNARVATTTAQTLSTDFENGDTIDGVTLATNDRVLIKDQSTGNENGIYVVNASGSPTRATDMNTGAEASGAVCYVNEGTANSGKGYHVTTQGTITIDSTTITWEERPSVNSTATNTTANAYASGGISATNVQTWLEELADERLDTAITFQASTGLELKLDSGSWTQSATALSGASTSIAVRVKDDSLVTSMYGPGSIDETALADGEVTAIKMEDVSANSVICRPEATTGSRSSIALVAERLVGRAASGNVAALDRNDINPMLTKEFAMVSGTLDQENGEHHVIADTASPNPFVIPAPTNYVPGKQYQLTIEADATDSHTLSFAAAWKLPIGQVLPFKRPLAGVIKITYRVSDIEASGTEVRGTMVEYAS